MPWSDTVQEIRDGNEAGVETLCAAVSECARALLFHSVEAQAVDDHVQEVMIIVLGAIRSGELRDPHCLMAFVRTVTRRQATIHIRRAILRRRRLTSVESENPAAPLHESPEARFSGQERLAAIGIVLEKLSPRDREILVRFYCEEQDSRLICREMRLTSTQFRLYKSRALAKCVQSTRPLRIA
jgi:RNA polymerase sigma factor (sigma-70 family)